MHSKIDHAFLKPTYRLAIVRLLVDWSWEYHDCCIVRRRGRTIIRLDPTNVSDGMLLKDGGGGGRGRKKGKGKEGEMKGKTKEEEEKGEEGVEGESKQVDRR